MTAFVVTLAMAALMVNRLYVIIRDKAITVRGGTYSRSDTPFNYWFMMFVYAFGLLLNSGAAIFLTIRYAGMIR